MKTAIKSDWKNKPMPNENIIIDTHIVFSDGDFTKIKLGFIPKDMDERWFSFTENNCISFHRSWTGNCIYQAYFKKINKGIEVYKLIANRNKEEYKGDNIEEDKSDFIFLVNRLLLENKTYT